MSTGASGPVQKKSPDPPEAARGKSGKEKKEKKVFVSMAIIGGFRQLL